MLDSKDESTYQEGLAGYEKLSTPVCGDWVRFAGGELRLISRVLFDKKAQTSKHGSLYLHSSGECSFSGSLDLSVSMSDFKLLPERREQTVWFFHHNIQCRGGGVYLQMPRRVWVTAEAAPKG